MIAMNGQNMHRYIDRYFLCREKNGQALSNLDMEPRN